MDFLEIKNLSLTYYNKKTKVVVDALKNVSINFELGKITVIVGEIGSGKSSLVKVICGILPYDKGDILYKGKNIDDIYVEDRNFAYICQDVILFPKKTVFDNLCVSLLGKKIKKEEIRERVYKIAEEFNIEFLLGRKPKEISVGQIQRVNLAKTFLRNPDIYILDEPFSNLDLKTNLELRKKLKYKIKDNNSTCIFVTHNINDALYLADNVIVMKDSEIIASGKKDIVFHSNNPEVISLLHAEEEYENKML